MKEIYWILATLTMVVLLVNSIYMFVKNIINERDFKKFKKKQQQLIEEQFKKMMLEEK